MWKFPEKEYINGIFVAVYNIIPIKHIGKSEYMCLFNLMLHFLPPSPLSKASSLVQALHFCWQVFCMYCLHSMCIACLMDVLPALRAGMHILES
jgi:hypothetical protein